MKTNNLINPLLNSNMSREDHDYDISVTCQEDRMEEASCFSTFTLCLDEDNEWCDVSLFTDDDASFLEEELDDISLGEESYYIEEVILGDSSRSTTTEIETDMDITKIPVAVMPLAAQIIQNEEREWKPLLARRNVLRERRRGGRRPNRRSGKSTTSKTALRRSVTE